MGLIPMRYVAALAVLVAVLAGAAWGIRQYGNGRAEAVRAEIAQEAVQGAVQAKKAAVKVDVAQAQQRRSLSDSVVFPGVQKEKHEQGLRKSPDPADRLRVLNDWIDRANAGVASASSLPE